MQPHFETFKHIVNGIGSLVDILPAQHRQSFGQSIFGQSEFDAMMGDWEKVGSDMYRAINQFERDHHDELGSKTSFGSFR